MKATRNQPPFVRPWAASAAKVSFQDMERNRAYFNVNMLPTPSNFFGPEGPADPSGLARDMRYMRLLTAISLRGDEERLRRASRRVFEMIHIDPDARDMDGNVIIDNRTLEDVAKSAGFDESTSRHMVQSEIGSEKVKAELKRTTSEAINRGAFGAPFIVVESIETSASTEDEQVYFGSDRFEQMAFVNAWPWMGPDPGRPGKSSKL